MEDSNNDLSDIIYPLIDSFKICGMTISNEHAVKVWLDSENISMDDHDLNIVFAFLHSSSNSISDYLNDSNEVLHAVNVLSDKAGLETIHEETEIEVTPASTLSEQVAPVETDSSIPLDSHVNISELNKPNPMPIEYESVSMIQIKRIPSSLTALHRYVYYDIDMLSLEDQEAICSLLQEKEGDRSYITSYFSLENHPEKVVPSFFPCKVVFCMIWELQNDVDDAGESRLFSSWKTMVNLVSKSVLKAVPIGFMDITNMGVYMYKSYVCSIISSEYD